MRVTTESKIRKLSQFAWYAHGGCNCTPAPSGYAHELIQLGLGKVFWDQDIFVQSENMRWVFLGLQYYSELCRKPTEAAKYRRLPPPLNVDSYRPTIKFTT